MTTDALVAHEAEVVETSVAPIPHGRLTARGDVQDVRDAMTDLKLIRTFIASEMVEGVDYGVIPGTGDKKNMLLPGAQKVSMFFNARPDYEIERIELGGGHVEFSVKTRLISRVSERVIGAGVGSCTTMEGKYRYRKAERKCPECGSSAIIKGKKEYGGGWVCFEKKGGCKAKFRDGDESIEQQDAGQVENPNIYDTRNTVLKMAKKRSLVDASIGLGCLSELFTQDLDDIFEINEVGGLESNVAPSRNSSPQQPRSESPVAQPTTPDSAPTKSRGNEHAIIQVASAGKAWKYGSTPCQMFTDTDGLKWKFVGAAVDLAHKSGGAPIAIEYIKEQTPRGVVSAVVSAALVGGAET